MPVPRAVVKASPVGGGFWASAAKFGSANTPAMPAPRVLKNIRLRVWASTPMFLTGALGGQL
jgi:hypothetical protein